MNSYDFLAGCYDELTYDVDYSAWADYVEKHFRRRPLPGKTVLDLACGTGSLTRELAERGYEMIGVDQSPEMLAAAVETLTDRERDIVRMRYGLGGGGEHTQKEVADMMGISQSYISRLEKRIMTRLKREILKQTS